jgi:hypothetical protein
MSQSVESRFVISEVINYGGFFGGNTITFDAAPLESPDDTRTIVIDGKDLNNVPDRHMILAGMVLELVMEGERVDRARLLAAPSQAELRDALGPASVAGPLDGPALLSGRCPSCGRWVLADLLRPAGCELCTGSASSS